MGGGGVIFNFDCAIMGTHNVEYHLSTVSLGEKIRNFNMDRT